MVITMTLRYQSHCGWFITASLMGRIFISFPTLVFAFRLGSFEITAALSGSLLRRCSVVCLTLRRSPSLAGWLLVRLGRRVVARLLRRGASTSTGRAAGGWLLVVRWRTICSRWSWWGFRARSRHLGNLRRWRVGRVSALKFVNCKRLCWATLHAHESY